MYASASEQPTRNSTSPTWPCRGPNPAGSFAERRTTTDRMIPGRSTVQPATALRPNSKSRHRERNTNDDGDTAVVGFGDARYGARSVPFRTPSRRLRGGAVEGSAGNERVVVVTGHDFHAVGARRARLDRYEMVARSFSQLTGRQLREVVEGAQTLSTGIGGSNALLYVGGLPVFVKRVPLTDLERHPDNVMSTANLFELPLGCQYGVGSPGFGVWRELTANMMTTSWVLAGRASSFPLMYHWRVLDGTATAGPLADELTDVERTVAYWHGSSGVRRRIDAIDDRQRRSRCSSSTSPTRLPTGSSNKSRQAMTTRTRRSPWSNRTCEPRSRS